MTRRRLWPLAAVGVLALVAGLALFADGRLAGEDSADEYEGAVLAARNGIDDALTQVVLARSAEQVIDRMKRASVVSTRAAEALGQTDVPGQFEDEHDRLTAALRSFATDLDATAEQAKLTPEFISGNGLSFEGWTLANQVFAAFREQGLEIPALASR